MPACIGLVLLNLLAPGLGLVRLGFGRAGLPWLIAPALLVFALALILAVIPTPSFRMFAAIFLVVMLVGLAVLIVPAVQTWRRRQCRRTERQWWSRWYGLVAIIVVTSAVSQLGVHVLHRLYKPFYAPSESMEPTIRKNEKLIADMRGGRHPRRGELVLFAEQGRFRNNRVVALAGDQIAIRNGIPVVNGRMAELRQAGSTRVLGFDGVREAVRMKERLPGEEDFHFILDQGPTEFDEMNERTVPPGHIFVLGDNRDLSADSRVPIGLGGVQMVPTSAIQGRPLYIHWSTDRSRIGISFNAVPRN